MAYLHRDQRSYRNEACCVLIFTYFLTLRSFSSVFSPSCASINSASSSAQHTNCVLRLKKLQKRSFVRFPLSLLDRCWEEKARRKRKRDCDAECVHIELMNLSSCYCYHCYCYSMIYVSAQFRRLFPSAYRDFLFR